MLVSRTSGKVRFRLMIWTLARRSKMESAVLTSVPRPIHTSFPLESDSGYFPLSTAVSRAPDEVF